jgi:hypothetical protein
MAEHTLDVAEIVDSLKNIERWHEIASSVGKDGRKRLLARVGNAILCVMRDGEEIYRGLDEEQAVIAYNTAFETR